MIHLIKKLIQKNKRKKEAEAMRIQLFIKSLADILRQELDQEAGQCETAQVNTPVAFKKCQLAKRKKRIVSISLVAGVMAAGILCLAIALPLLLGGVDQGYFTPYDKDGIVQCCSLIDFDLLIVR